MATMYFVLCLLALTPYLVIGDVYMHNMRGSNNRLNENSVNTQNQNRLFDSQNNAKGGYLCGESNPTDPFVAQPMRYFEGSKLPIEWTNQHGCGANYNSHCDIVLQYMCDSGSKTYNGQSWGVTDGTDTNSGRHEPAAYRTKCETRSRNKGLWIADRNLNQDTAAFTRQNNNGNKYGTECPEERDYYPYWHPTPWKDIAILTSNVSRCDYYKKESMNVIGKYECECTNWQTSSCSSTCWQYNNANECNQNTQCTWAMKTHGNQFRPNNELESNVGAPDCKEAPWSRDNHLGDVIGLGNMGYNWTMPSPQQACGSTQCNACVLRIRYNITTTDLDGLQKWQVTDVSPLVQTTWELDSNYNGAKKIRMVNPNADSSTVTYYSDNPTVDIGSGSPLNIALDTDQNPRAFEDRSHTWKLAARPADIPSTATIWNLNVRGKRGNIVQAYPAVEYDFIPNYLQIYEGDYVHVQWVGSNRNPNGNAGQGNTPNDRNNFMEIDNLNANVPLPISRWRLFTPDTEKQYIKAFATGDTSGTRANIDNQLQNVSPYFDGYQAYGNKFLQPKVGTYYYMCSRNNNFSNRSQKGTLIVKPASERPSN